MSTNRLAASLERALTHHAALALRLALVWTLWVGVASAPAQAESLSVYPGWYFPLGLNTGLALHDSGAGLLLGLEASAVFLEGTWWGGVVGDALYDFGHDGWRVGVGGELGWFLFGLEASMVLDFQADSPRIGTRFRALLTGALIGYYFGWVHLFDDRDLDIGELGLLLKWPFRF